MIRYTIVSIIGGILFGFLDVLINANPFAQRLFQVYKPIARTSMNPIQGILIDLAYGFAIAAVFLMLYQSLPGQSGLIKGISLAILMWFFRVVMYALSHWVMFNVSMDLILYLLVSGLIEMLLLGIFFGLTLKPI